MSQDQTQEQSIAGLNEPGSVLHVEEDDFDILKAGYEELSVRYATLLNERDILRVYHRNVEFYRIWSDLALALEIV